VADETTARPASAGRCPTCGSPDPAKHPAVQEGGEVQPCKDAFHPPLTPELDRQSKAIKDGAHRIGEFLDWLEEQGYVLARYAKPDADGEYEADGYDRYSGEVLHQSYVGKEKLIAGFFGLDLDKIEAERMALLEHLRARQ
jgi:hypothetical protein